MTISVRRAHPGDLDAVLALIRESARWMHQRGFTAWPAAGFPAERIAPRIDEGTVWLAEKPGGGPIGTLTLDDYPDVEFKAAGMDPAEQSALIVHKLATVRAGHPAHVPAAGRLLLEWAIDRAARQGAAEVWLNVARNATRLQAYYAAAGFTHAVTVQVDDRKSGSLWRRPATLNDTAAALTDPAALESER